MTALRVASPGDVESDADPADGRWSQLEMLAAALVDEMRILRWLYVSAHSDKKPSEQPKPIRRPGAEKRKPRLSAAGAEFLFNHINGLPQPDDGLQLTVIEGGGGA